eukprot:TRINITY_DN28864_c0_g1_i3.p1 TRINITY_DN28864_c0_g1~~TRINITY_DN28864_c0_g1_i3.p1  ORF type:complete len:103 (-),score=16.01 TRINITY_DN28864_c0_g1_i3:46-354(-)
MRYTLFSLSVPSLSSHSVRNLAAFSQTAAFGNGSDTSFEMAGVSGGSSRPVSYTHLRAHETPEHLVCRLLLEKKKNNEEKNNAERKNKNKKIIERLKRKKLK